MKACRTNALHVHARGLARFSICGNASGLKRHFRPGVGSYARIAAGNENGERSRTIVFRRARRGDKEEGRRKRHRGQLRKLGECPFSFRRFG